MRKSISNVFIMLSLLAITSCGSDKDEVISEGPTVKSTNEVQLKATINTTETRAGLGPLGSNFTVDIPIGIYAHNGAWLAGATANKINNDAATVSGAAGHNVTFAGGPYYYPSDGSTLSFFAFAPRGTEATAAGAGTAPFVNIPINGQDDVMWCTATGQKVGSNPAQAPVLAFNHVLTQLQFTFKSDVTYPASGNVVTSLLVKTQPNMVNMNVGTGAYTVSGTADMQALSSANQSAGIAITSAGTNANSPVITTPASGAAAYTLSIVVKPAGSESTVTYNANVNITTAVGSAHMIILTFTETAVTATTTVADWLTGTGGSVTVL